MSTNSNQDDSSQEEEPGPSQGSEANSYFPSHTLDSIQFLARILHLRQTLAGQSQGVLETMCREIRHASRRQAQLILLRKQGKPARVPVSWHSFEVEANYRSYGRLYFAPDPAQPAELVVPFHLARFIASFCAFLLFSLETDILNKIIYQVPNSSASPSFTPREKEILELICQGYDLQAIADRFQTSPSTVRKQREHISAKFGVQGEQEAVFAAFSAGLFSPLEDLTPEIVHPFLKT
jgi:DNA-binding CsgD family transcriptional regulator